MKDEAHGATAKQSQGVFVHGIETLTIHRDFPGCGTVQSAEQIKLCTLAGTGRYHHNRRGMGIDIEVNSVEGAHNLSTHLVVFC